MEFYIEICHRKDKKIFNLDVQISKMKNAEKNKMIFFYTLSLSICCLSPSSLFVPPCVFPSVPLCVSLSVCLSNSQPPGSHQSAFKFCATLPPAKRVCGPTCCDLHRPTIRTPFYRGLLLHSKRELSITYLLLLDKGGHVNRRNEAV